MESRSYNSAPCINVQPAVLTSWQSEDPIQETAGVAKGGSLLCRLTQFAAIKYCIGGQIYSADDIEHGILRGNRPTAASIPVLLGHPEWSKGYFKKDDIRLKLVSSTSE